VVEAQFSLPFVVALALVDGRTSLSAFDRPLDVEPRLRDLFAAVTIVPRETATGAVAIEIRYADGRQASATVSTPRGHPSRPLDADAVLAKFEDCNAFAGEVLRSAQVRDVVATALGLSDLASTTELTGLLAV
jgi:2-methylcitrate dehydratase PrpD